MIDSLLRARTENETHVGSRAADLFDFGLGEGSSAAGVKALGPYGAAIRRALYWVSDFERRAGATAERQAFIAAAHSASNRTRGTRTARLSQPHTLTRSRRATMKLSSV